MQLKTAKWFLGHSALKSTEFKAAKKNIKLTDSIYTIIHTHTHCSAVKRSGP